RGREQVAKGFSIAATYPTPKLMQVAEPKMMGVVDDNGIDVGNIHAAFHDVGTNQHIIFPVDKVEDTLFQFVAFHLPVRITDTEIGAKRLDDGCHLGKSLDTVVDKEDLSAPFGLIIDRIADKVFVIAMQFRLDRLAVRRRRVDDAQIPGAHKTELQRPGDRRSCKGKTVHMRPKGLDLFLVCDAKLLFFIDDEQAEVFELYFFS